ncbi:hypothetical protein KVR01_003621 [Diaporthe batatas]|uniref:uncharacterized protein n=1 Tax=Diaporthe batatas TaxID=748121 RepID=UPI001D048D3E|nr:uncharacterized protein KVR01_003621 [Diaporthe batatas]KAG8167932.1 hypothetical protein KVR01_003621 [Diaporthe batatas]
MARIEDLPVELVEFITDYLGRTSDLAALARTSHKFNDAVDPILYKFAKANVSNLVPRHPLWWAAQHGQTGTVRKALASGIDVNMAFLRSHAMEHDRHMWRDSEEMVDMPPLESDHEWQPQEDDTDHDDTRSLTSTDDQPDRYSDLRGRNGPNMYGDEDSWDDYDVLAAMDPFHAESATNSMAEDDSLSGDQAAAALDFFGPFDPAFDGGVDSDEENLFDEDDEDGLDEDPGEDSEDSSHSRERRHIVTQTFRALHLAARAGNDDVVGILLDHGASIDACSHQLGRRTHFLSLGSDIYYGASISDAGYSPLHLAICHFRSSTARLLLSRGASSKLSEPDRKDAMTALHAAAATGQVDLCKHLLDGGFVELDAPDQTGLTPFYYAYRSGQWNSTVALLLERGANINCSVRRCPRVTRASVEDGKFGTVLYEACTFGRYYAAKKLIYLGADVNRGLVDRDTQCRSPLHAVCDLTEASSEAYRHHALRTLAPARNDELERLELIKLMLKSGAELEATTRPERESALHIAANHRDVAVLRLLLAEGAHVESQSSDGRTALIHACDLRGPRGYYTSHLHLRRESQINAVNMLVDHGANLNAKDKAGDTALHRVCSVANDPQSKDHDKIVRRLLQRGAEGNAQNRSGITPFEAAFRGGVMGVCDILARHGHYPRKQEDFERMILDLIQLRPYDLSALDFLIDLDVQGFLFSKSEYLMKMIDGRHVKMASRYLERCPRFPPLSPKQKLTVLREGLALDNKELVKQILGTKVSINVPDKNGHTPLYVAVQRYRSSDHDLIKALLEAGSDMHFKPPSSTIMTPLEKAITEGKEILVQIMLDHQPIRDNPKAPKGVYLHAAARRAPSKRMISTLVRSGASVTELDGNNDTPLSVFLKSIADLPQWTAFKRRAGNRIFRTIWYLWSKELDINFRNNSGKAITSYLLALRMYDGDSPARKRIAQELELGLYLVPAEGVDGEKGLKTLRFRHSVMGLGDSRGGSKRAVCSY